MPSKIVVAGVTSLYMSAGVTGFPLDYSASRKPTWMRGGITGSAGHIAQILHKLGDEVRLCTVAGDDPVGHVIRADIRARGMADDGVVDGASSMGIVLVGPDGRRMGLPYLAAVNTIEYPVDMFCRQASGADLAVLTNAGFVRPLVRHAERLGLPVAVDAHLISDIDDEYNRPWLEIADVIFCSHERLPCATTDWIAQVFGKYPGCQVVGVGRGHAGSVLGLRDGLLVRAEAVAPRGVVSTAGAGDAWFASFLHGWIATGNAIAALEAAVLHVGWKIGDPFPGASSLTEAELRKLRDRLRVRMQIDRWDKPHTVTPHRAGQAAPGSAAPAASPT